MADLYIPDNYGNATIIMQASYRPNPWTMSHGYHLNTLVASPSANAQTIFGGWNQTGAPLKNTVVSAGVTFVGVKVVENRGGVMFEGEYTGNSTGSSSDPLPPPNVSVLVQKRTGLSGKKHRGRFYFPAINLAESVISVGGNISAATLTALNTQFNLVRTSLVTAGLPMCLLHREVLAPDEISTLVTEEIVATQRRRLR